MSPVMSVTSRSLRVTFAYGRNCSLQEARNRPNSMPSRDRKPCMRCAAALRGVPLSVSSTRLRHRPRTSAALNPAGPAPTITTSQAAAFASSSITALAESRRLTAFLAGLFRPCRADRCGDVFALFRRRNHRLQAQRLQPQFPAPALGVVEMLILLIFHFIRRFLQDFLLLAARMLGALGDQLPIGVVLGFRQYHAFARHQL